MRRTRMSLPPTTRCKRQCKPALTFDGRQLKFSAQSSRLPFLTFATSRR
jgi:hypothetical protein